MTKLYRVQDKEGRGPFRPGFSQNWLRRERSLEEFPAVHVAFGTDWINTVPKNWHYGTGCRDRRTLRKWFSDIELEILHNFGYSIVEIDFDFILGETANQVLFCRKKPLWKI